MESISEEPLRLVVIGGWLFGGIAVVPPHPDRVVSDHHDLPTRTGRDDNRPIPPLRSGHVRIDA